ncbi:hypothetical protein Cni_G14719 [Canna indica]|uniref:BHLH domain-containing protein n=1 Tax=Canna indica TaxID=4628 RepID=A0AAQ3KBZ8_9LILI|nr:hypothetical protein Cni_G14719 [Canna indica]
MAEEASETSVVSSSANSWWDAPPNSVSTWNSPVNPWPPSSRRSHSSCEDDLHSGLGMNSSSSAATVDLSGEPSENQLWNQVLLNVGSSTGDMRNHRYDDGSESFLRAMNPKGSLTADQMLDAAACDYLKKADSSWESFSNPLSLSNYSHEGSRGGQAERSTENMVSNWSIAPPSPFISHLMAPQYSAGNLPHVKHESETSASFMPYMGAASPSLDLRPCISNSNSNELSIPWSSTRSLSDLISFTGCLNKPPAADLRPSRSYLKGLDSRDTKKKGYDSLSTKGRGRFTGTAEGKKKSSDDSSETVLLKKPKHDQSSAVSSLKAPKVKLADKITALQQLVSPFGKTDTASVLFETINCIKVLQEQVQVIIL